MKPANLVVFLLLTILASPSLALHDVGVTELVSPRTYIIPVWQRPAVRIGNFGSVPEEDIPVHFRVDSAGVVVYDRLVIVAGPVAPGTQELVKFPTWQPTQSRWAMYGATAFVTLPGDSIPRNDTLKANSWSVPEFLSDTFVYLVGMQGIETPVIDGRISRTEYEWPPPYDFSDLTGRAGAVPQVPGSMLFYGLHDETHVYLAFDLRLAPTRENSTTVNVCMDENRDFVIPAGDSTEGCHRMFVRGGIDSVVYSYLPGQQCPGCVSASSADNGNLQIEVMIPIGPRPGDYTINYHGGTSGAAVSAWRRDSTCVGWWPPTLPLRSWMDARFYRAFIWGWVGINESGPWKEMHPSPRATVVRDALCLPLVEGSPREPNAMLLDLSGRRVIDLHAGANDVSTLAPGVYFVCPASGGKRGAASTAKVLITR